MSFIEARNVTKVYINSNEPVIALKNINISLPSKGMVLIYGKSGGGKSTLINVLFGIEKKNSGEIFIDGKNIDDFNEENWSEFRNNYCSFVYQDLKLINNLTVFENISIVYKGNPEEKIKKINEVLDLLEIFNLKNKKVSKLSGGQRQRVAVARSLLNDSRIICLDEPTSNLDLESSSIIFEALNKISNNSLVLIVSHDSDIKNKCSNIIELDEGVVIKNTISIDDSINNYEPKKYKNNNDLLKISFKITWLNILMNVVLVFIFSFFIFYQTNNIIQKSYKYSDNTLNNIENRYVVKKTYNTYFTDEEISHLIEKSSCDYVFYNDEYFEDSKYNSIYIIDKNTKDKVFLPIHNTDLDIYSDYSLELSDNEIILRLPIAYKSIIEDDFSNINLSMYIPKDETNTSYFKIKDIVYYKNNDKPSICYSVNGLNFINAYYYLVTNNEYKINLKGVDGGLFRFSDSIPQNYIATSNNTLESVGFEIYENDLLIESYTYNNLYREPALSGIDMILINPKDFIKNVKEYSYKNIYRLSLFVDNTDWIESELDDFIITSSNFNNKNTSYDYVTYFLNGSLAAFAEIGILVLLFVVMYFLLYVQIRKYRLLYSVGFEKRRINKIFNIQFIIFGIISCISIFIAHYYMYYTEKGFERFFVSPLYYLLFMMIILLFLNTLRITNLKRIKIKGIDEY